MFYFGRAEVRTGLARTRLTGRASMAQTGTATLTTFFLGSRPGSLSASAAEFRDRAKVRAPSLHFPTGPALTEFLVFAMEACPIP